MFSYFTCLKPCIYNYNFFFQYLSLPTHTGNNIEPSDKKTFRRRVKLGLYHIVRFCQGLCTVQYHEGLLKSALLGEYG